MSDTTINAIGWLSATILLITLIRQVVTQWRDRNSAGVSAWLFVGQLAASIGFTIYSVLVDNWVFIVANSCIAIVAIVGECTYLRNRRLAQRSSGVTAAQSVRNSVGTVELHPIDAWRQPKSR